ncbi:MAG: tail fiber domain-containing protein [Bacteroidales bacterium]|nr:tail fiber domain-containing protein [Bacteroidales bacterium]
MKNLFTLSVLVLSFTASVFLPRQASSQPPQAFKYQAVVRDNAGEILQNQAVGIRISIHNKTAAGYIVYQETFSETTNQFGLVNLQIGNGTPTIGTFEGIEWSSNSKFLETEIDPNGGTAYISMGTSELLSVPYALYAGDDGDWTTSGNDIFSANSGNVGIGTSTPGAKLEVAGHIRQTATGYSVFLGEGAGTNDDLSANYNVFIGYLSGNLNTTGSGNTANGSFSFCSNTTGELNTAYGSSSLYANTTGMRNTACGYNSLKNNTSGNENTANGYASLNTNTQGNHNTASGYTSLYYNTVGNDNTANGYRSLYYNTSGSQNVASGYKSLYSNTTGNYNTANGYSSIFSNTGGHYNTASGHNSLYANISGAYNTANGYHALEANTTGNYNTAIGASSLVNNTTGTYNTACGFSSLAANTVGASNTAFGTYALPESISNSNNTAIGDHTLFHTTNNENTAIGASSLYYNTTGSGNTATGFKSLNRNSDGYNNTANGRFSLYYNNSGNRNTAYGYYSMYNNTYGVKNVALGAYAGDLAESNAYCTFVGYATDNSSVNPLINSMALGNQAVITSNNQVRVGNSSVTSIGGYQNWTNVSDKRFKKNIKKNVPGLDFILKLQAVTYNLDVDKLDDFLNIPDSLQNDENLKKGAIEKASMLQTGFIAQEVEEAAQSLGYDFSGMDAPNNEAGLYGLRYAEFVVPLVKAVQEQQEMIKTQQAIIEELKAENNAFKSEIEAIKTSLGL